MLQSRPSIEPGGFSPAARRPMHEWVNMLGLDAVLAALVWLKVFAWTFRTRVDAVEYPVLGAVVWLIYMADRMLDGLLSPSTSPQQSRHRFAAQHWRRLVPLMLAVTAAVVWLLLYHVREVVSTMGLKVAAGVAVYFILTPVIRKNLTGLTGALALCGCIAIALMQGNLLPSGGEIRSGPLWPQLWRGALAGILLTVVLTSVRRPGAPPPWLLPRKLLAGWLFAMGVALAPCAHRELWDGLLFGTPVLVFAAVCAMNSLAIRLVETEPQEPPCFDHAMVRQLFPWVLGIVTAGALMEWYDAPFRPRPLLAACGAAGVLLAVLYALRRRFSASAFRALADAAVILPGAVAALFFLKK